ncbi:hypothetical protein BC827DRAFT_1163902 [Russula dissimulans]|nr:hypothetical protein BC827DRAFT_1163902 [Russula dissimulans]
MAKRGDMTTDDRQYRSTPLGRLLGHGYAGVQISAQQLSKETTSLPGERGLSRQTDCGETEHASRHKAGSFGDFKISKLRQSLGSRTGDPSRADGRNPGENMDGHFKRKGVTQAFGVRNGVVRTHFIGRRQLFYCQTCPDFFTTRVSGDRNLV